MEALSAEGFVFAMGRSKRGNTWTSLKLKRRSSNLIRRCWPIFLAAYRDDDKARAQKIHNETKGLLKGVTVPLQLSRRYLMAKQDGNEAEAKESLQAMAFIGSFEQAQNGEFFFLN